MEFNQNYSNCLAKVTHWGEYIYTNVCSGKVTAVGWGFGEYLAAILGILVLVAVSMFIAFMLNLDAILIRKILKDRKNGN